MNAQYICPVVTAFGKDGTVDMNCMRIIYDRLIDSGLDGIAVMGSSGEFYSMSMEEAKQFAKASLEYMKGRIRVYVGTGRLTAEETIELSSYALEAGADAVMVVGPYYIGTGAAGVEAYYDRVANAVNGNIILYNYPDRTGHDITAGTVKRLLTKHKNIVGFKDTVAAPSHTRELIKKIKPHYPEFKIYSGYDDNFAHVVTSGGDGCIAALSNLVPEICASWVNAFREENLVKIAEIQKKIDGLMDFYSISSPFMPAMKYALGTIGIPIRLECRLPAIEVGEEEKRQIDILLNGLREKS